MRYIFNFPDIGEGLEEGTINEWYVKKGQTVEVGDPLVNMETDKVAADIPSPKNGTITAIYGKVGETVKVGSPLVEIEVAVEEGKEVPDTGTKVEMVEEEGAGVVGTLEVAGNNAYMPASEEFETGEAKPEKSLRKVLATPVARAYARDLEININNVKGTGPAGRVTKKDILAYSIKTKAEPLPAVTPNGRLVETSEAVEYEPLSQIRKTIAKNMSESKHNAAHMTVFEETEIDLLAELRNRFKEKFAVKGIKLTYLPFVVKAVASALKKHKALNSQLDIENNRMIYKNYYNIGFAVDTDYGLVVPVIKNADQLSILELSEEINKLAEKARKRELSLDEMKDGTFTITNYGPIGGLYAVPVINYPQAAILGLGRIHKKPVVKNDELAVSTVLPLSMSVDHRIVDGGEAARFLNQVIEYISDPASLIME